VTEVVDARPGTIAGAPQTDLVGQLHEDAANRGLRQMTTALGNEEVRATPRSQMRIAPLRVAA
jgi:hypothetical protein